MDVKKSAPNGGKRAGCRGKPGPGRPRGSKNKINRDVREMVLGALSELGGQAWLVKQARKARNDAFMRLVSRVIPQDLKLEAIKVVEPTDRLEVARRGVFLLTMLARNPKAIAPST